jgi:hypothetical protein
VTESYQRPKSPLQSVLLFKKSYFFQKSCSKFKIRKGERKKERKTFLMTQANFEPTCSCINTSTILKPSCLWRWNRQSVPKRRHTKFRRREITQKKKTYNIHNTAKIWNQERKTLNVTENKVRFSVLPLFNECLYIKEWHLFVRSLCIKRSTLTSVNSDSGRVLLNTRRKRTKIYKHHC